MLKRFHREDASTLLSRIYAVETNPHPDPLPFTKGEGNLRWHRIRVTEQGSKTGAFQLSSPRSERGEEQGEGRFRLHTCGLTAPDCRDIQPIRAALRVDAMRKLPGERFQRPW